MLKRKSPYSVSAKIKKSKSPTIKEIFTENEASLLRRENQWLIAALIQATQLNMFYLDGRLTDAEFRNQNELEVIK